MELMIRGTRYDWWVQPSDVLVAADRFNNGETDPQPVGFYQTLIQVLLHG